MVSGPVSSTPISRTVGLIRFSWTEELRAAQLSEKIVVECGLELSAEPCHHIFSRSYRVPRVATARGGKNVCEPDLPSSVPLRTILCLLEFPPHRASPQKQEGLPHGILSGALQVWMPNDSIELVTILVELGMVKFAPAGILPSLLLPEQPPQPQAAIHPREPAR